MKYTNIKGPSTSQESQHKCYYVKESDYRQKTVRDKTNKKTKEDSLFPSHLLTTQQEVSKSSYWQCNMDCNHLSFATTEASEMKPTVHQYHNSHWTLTHDSTLVFQAKRLEIWQDKKWVSSAEKLQPSVHQIPQSLSLWMSRK